MSWTMMVCCGLPLLLLIILAVGGKSLGVSTQSILGWVGFMLVLHLIMMRPRKSSPKEHDGKDNKDHSGHGCCH